MPPHPTDDRNASAKKSLRLFYALWPDDATRAALTQLQSATHGNQTRPENLHLTLAFLGQQPAALLPVLQTILTGLSKPEITLTIDRLGYFSRHRIAWAGIRKAPDALFALQQQLMQELARHNISSANQTNFKPHITLARDATPPSDIPFTPINWQAQRIVLVQSTTLPEGVRYRVLG